MAKGKTINLGEMAIAIALNTKALQDGLNEVKVQLKKNAKDVQDTGKDYDKLAIVAGVAFYKIAQSVRSGISAYNESRSALVGLKSIADGTGNSFAQAQKFIESYTQDGLIPASQAATALKNLLSRGYTETQAVDVLNRLKDSAAFGRQASLELGQAVASATEGLKNENSILVDNAGVTKNVSVMWKEYAETVGKSVNDLTKQEKIQAEYNGVMKETSFQVGDAAKLSQELAGAQAQNAAATLRLKQAYGEALAPALALILSVINPIIEGITELVKANPALSAAIVTTITVFTLFVTASTTLVSAINVLRPALAALSLSFSGLLLNPVVLALTAIAGIAAFVAVQVNKAKKAQEEYNNAVKEHNKLLQEGIDKAHIATQQEKVDALKDLSNAYDETNKKLIEFKASYSELQKSNDFGIMKSSKQNDQMKAIQEYTNKINDLKKQMKEYGATEQNITQIIKEKEIAIKEANRVTVDEVNTQGRSLAQDRAKLVTQQNLINQYKNAKKGSTEYRNAEAQLAELYPQYATAAGIQIEAINNIINAQINAKDSEWKLIQAKIAIRKQDLLSLIETEQKKIEALQPFIEANTDNDAGVRTGLMSKADASRRKLEELRKEVEVFEDLGKVDLTKVTGVMPASDYGKDYKSYENTALNSALKVHDHRVKMSQLSKDQELKDLQDIMSKYVKNADEKMDLEERIYDVRQEIIEKNKKADQDSLKASEDALAKRTDASLEWIEKKKNLGELSVSDELSAYDRIIAYHRQYLSKLLAGKKELSEEEKRIKQQEIDTIKEFEEKKYNISLEYQKKLQEDTISDVNNLEQGVESALRSKYGKEREIREDALEKEMDAVENWRDAYTDSIEAVYDSKIKAIEQTSEAQKKALQAEIDALDREQELKDRQLKDSSELAQINSLKNQIEYEHDDFNRAKLQKELNKILLDREKRLNEEQLEDKKDALKKQIDAVEDNADKQKEILEQQKKNELASIEARYQAEKLSIEKRKADWDKFYSDKLTTANIEAEAEKLIMKNKQTEIIELLKGFGEDYKIAGQTLGEKLYEGFKPQVDAIKSLIAGITEQISAARSAAVSVAASFQNSTVPISVTSANIAAKASEAASKTTIVNQTNNFNSPVSTASEVARKTKQVSLEIAKGLV